MTPKRLISVLLAVLGVLFILPATADDDKPVAPVTVSGSTDARNRLRGRRRRIPLPTDTYQLEIERVKVEDEIKQEDKEVSRVVAKTTDFWNAKEVDQGTIENAAALDRFYNALSNVDEAIFGEFLSHVFGGADPKSGDELKKEEPKKPEELKKQQEQEELKKLDDDCKKALGTYYRFRSAQPRLQQEPSPGADLDADLKLEAAFKPDKRKLL